MTPSLLRWLKRLSVVAVVVSGCAWLLAPDSEVPSARSSRAEEVATAPSTSQALRTRQGLHSEPEERAAQMESIPNGATAHVVDAQEEVEAAERAFEDRIFANIDHLTRSAEQARAEGHPERAELMEQRIQGLERRLDEFYSEL